MKVRPLYDRVVVKPLTADRDMGGFSMPETAREDFLLGSVLFTGDGYINEKGDIRPLLVKIGDTVLYGPYAGTKIRVDGQELLTMREGEIALILESA